MFEAVCRASVLFRHFLAWRFAAVKSRFSVEQIVAALKQAELGMPVADLIRQLGISEKTYYRWKKIYSGL